MKGLIPFGGMKIVGGAGTIGLSTTATLLNLWSATGGSVLPGTGASGNDGEQSVQADLTNNRMKLLPGFYEYTLRLVGTTDGTQDITAQLRKNAATLIDGTKSQRSWTLTIANLHVDGGVFQILETDVPGTLSNFADPATTGFAGAGGAPKRLVPVDVVLTSGAGTPTLTIKEASLLIKRIG